MESDAIDNLLSEITAPDVPDVNKVVADADAPKICPVCGSETKFLFNNWNQKVLMCLETDCPYPFSHELLFIKVDPDLASDEELESYQSHPSSQSQGTESIVSATDCSEINRLHRACESEDNLIQTITTTKKFNQEEMELREKRRKIEENITQNLEKIKELNRKLFDEKEDDSIKNEVLMESIYRVQDKTGLKLLKDDELEKLKKKVDVNKADEFRVDIASDHESIKIELRNLNKSELKNENLCANGNVKKIYIQKGT